MLVVGGVAVRIFLTIVIFCTYLSFTVYANWYIDTTPPLRTHPTTVKQDFCADAHGFTRECCWWVVLYALTNNSLTHQRSRLLRCHASLNSDTPAGLSINMFLQRHILWHTWIVCSRPHTLIYFVALLLPPVAPRLVVQMRPNARRSVNVTALPVWRIVEVLTLQHPQIPDPASRSHGARSNAMRRFWHVVLRQDADIASLPARLPFD